MNLRIWSGLTMLALFAGCGDGRVKMNLAETTGRVICDGKPVPFATVYFVPMADGKNANVGKFGMGTANENGDFVISTYDTNDGAVVGKHVIRVDRPLGDRLKGFQCDCVLGSELNQTEVEVVAGQSNSFEVVLTKATPQQKAIAAKEQAALEKELEEE